MSRNKLRFGALRGILAIALGTAALASQGCRQRESTQLEQMPLPHVRVAEVTIVGPRPVSQHLVPLQAHRRARLAPRQGGEVIALDVHEEQEVAEGETLVRFTGDDSRGGLISARASIERIEENLRDNERELETARTLLKRGVETSRSVQRLETTRVTLEAQLREARGQLVRARDRVGATALTAPFSGTVVSVDTEVGEYLSPGQVAVVLSQLDPIAVEVPLTQNELALHDQGGLDFTVRARGAKLEPTVDWIASEAVQGTNTFLARLEMPNPDRLLRAGELVDVEILGAAQADVKTVPSTAIRWTAERAYVLVLQGDKLDRVDVEVGEDIDGQVAIEGSIAPGQKVVSTGPIALLPGDSVEVVDAPAETLASD